mmetsp:Transcript_11617/g.24592  ORF Transcript_11617/g.24592 Transcript_11617/m.24592 type:complete len:684 (-) Transcript_11617:1719-3770(-)
MKSYGLPAAIAALSSLLMSTSAVVSETSHERSLDSGMVDVIRSDNNDELGGIGNILYNFHSNTQVVMSRSSDPAPANKDSTLRTATDNVVLATNRLRGATNVQGVNNGYWKQQKSAKGGKGDKKGCKKKTDGAFRAKDAKGTKGARISTASSQTNNEEWCHEHGSSGNGSSGNAGNGNKRPGYGKPGYGDFGNNKPGYGDNGDGSNKPGYGDNSNGNNSNGNNSNGNNQSGNTVPTLSPAPTATPSPTTIGGFRPSSMGADIAPAFIGQPTEPEPLCEVFEAEFSSNGDNKPIISFWSEGNDRGRESNGSAALARIVASPVKRSDTSEYKLTIDIKVDTEAAENDPKADANKDSKFDPTDVGLQFDEIVTPSIALYVVGCKTKSLKAAETYYWSHKNGRALQEADEGRSDFVAVRDWMCKYSISEDKSCSDNNICDVTCTTSLNYIGDVDSTLVEEKIVWSVKEYFSMMDDVTGWYPMQDIGVVTVDDVDTSDDNSGANAVIDTDLAQSRNLKAGPFIGAATGLLALLLLLVLFVRRRNRNEIEQISHLKLDEEADDDTFYNGSDGHSIGALAKHEYNTRDIHIVGEGDSVISHWTGYTGNGRGRAKGNDYEVEYHKSALINGISTDVHQCSSATCEICAQKRQAGLNFVSTGATADVCLPVRNRSLPSDASRDYIAEDTVEL